MRSSDSEQDKPQTYNWCDFLIEPIIDFFTAVGHTILNMLGWWFCHHCNKMHSPRVIKYVRVVSTVLILHTKREDVCSLGIRKEKSNEQTDNG